MIDFIIGPSNRDALCEKIARLDPTKLWRCEIREKRSKRSADQNRRLWKLYGALGEHIGLDADEVHQLMGYKFLRYQKEVNGMTQEFVTSTTKLDTKQMAEYQENIERWGAEAGFYFDYD